MKTFFRSFIFLFAAFLFFSGCASSPQEAERREITTPADFNTSEYSEFWDTWPEGSTPVFLGTAKRLSDRDSERNKALISAAFRATFYNSVEGLSKAYTRFDARGSLRLEDFSLDYDKITPESLVAMVGQLEIIKELQDNRGTYIIVRYKDGAAMQPLSESLRFSLRSNNWINKPPVIPGYRVSVGYRNQSSHPCDSIERADEMALEEMIKSISTKIISDTGSVDKDGQSASIKAITAIAEASVKGFYVIARYVSPDGRDYYSLGICPEIKNQ